MIWAELASANRRGSVRPTPREIDLKMRHGDAGDCVTRGRQAEGGPAANTQGRCRASGIAGNRH
jgi:hypothetical protein